MNRSRRALIAGTAVTVVVLVLAIFVPVVSVDNVSFYGHVSLSCYYLGFGGMDLQPKFYLILIPHFTFDCSHYLG